MQPGEPADAAHAAGGNPPQRGLSGGRFDFDDGGTYCGGWEDGKAHGHGVCTGPKGQGAYAGSWHYGFEVSGVYTWPSGSSYEGQWQNGKRHGLGVETRGRWLYRGEWTQGYKGRYGVRQSTTSNAKYEGTWANGLQDGYGSETYADGGTYQGQWLRGMRHGYGVRASAPFGLASHYRGGAAGGGGRDARGSLTSLVEAAGTPDPAEKRNVRIDDTRGGFVLTAKSDEPAGRRGSLAEKRGKKFFNIKIKKPRSTGELDKHGTASVRSGGSGSSWVSSVDSTHSAVTHASLHTDSNASFMVEDEHLDPNVTETYFGEWKNDKRSGFGVSERSDGLRYEGEWNANRKCGYGVTTFRDGTREEGKYKNNVLITSQKRKHMFLMRSAKFRERIDSAVNSAQRASKIALQKADIATSRTATARGKAEQADESADQAKDDCDIAQTTAKQFAPDFKHNGFDRIRLREKYRQASLTTLANKTILQEPEHILEGKTIPNHIPPTHTQIPQPSNNVPNTTSPRRSSTQYPRTVQTVGTRLTNVTNYDNDNRVHDTSFENYYDPRHEMTSHIPPGERYIPPESQNSYVPNPPQRVNRPEPLQHQQSVDYNTQPYQPTNYQPANYPAANYQPTNYQPTNYQPTNYQPTNYQSANYQQMPSGRRVSATPRTMPGQRPQQEWNALPGVDRRQSVIGQPQPLYNSQEGQTTESTTGIQPFGRHEFRTGTVHSEGASDRQIPPMEQQQQQQTYNQGPMVNKVNMNATRDIRSNGARPSIDYFDHYKRPPSVDRYGRQSRQSSVEGTAPSGGSRAGSVTPATENVVASNTTPSSRPMSRAGTPAGNGHLSSGRGSLSRAGSREPPPFEESLLRKRNLGQEILPSPYQPKRTESLYVAQNPIPPPAPVGGGGGRKQIVNAQTPLQRKKSLPDVASMPRMMDSGSMSREEVSALGSARREEVRRMHEETEKLRANPLLYLVSPQVKEWFSRQQLVILVLFINISLGIMFFKLLT